MIIFRGLGILAPIVFIIVYFALYWFCKIFSSPEMDQGWFVYVGAAIAGLATWIVGSGFNSEIYKIQRKQPEQEVYSHSLFFIPMEFWAIPFVIVAMVYGQKNTTKANYYKEREEKHAVKKKNDFDNSIVEKEFWIDKPKVGDYYTLRFKKYNNKLRKDITRISPFKVTDYKGNQIQLSSPFDDPTESEKKYYYKQKELLSLFESKNDQGKSYWLDKSALKKGINRSYNNTKDDLSYIPDFMGDRSFAINNLWRIDGPTFKYHTGHWNSSANKSPKVNLVIKNNGLAADIYAVQYIGSKITWGKDRYQSSGLIDFNKKRDHTPINLGENLYISGNISDVNSPRLIQVFCHDSAGRKFRFDIRPNGNDLTIERIELEGLEK